MKVSREVPANAYQAGEGFLPAYQKLVREVVIPYQYRVLDDQQEGVEKSHALENLRLAAKKLRGEEITEGFYGMVFQDSDVAKWLEAASYVLGQVEDPELEQEVDQVIALLGEAQQEDGYLNSYFTVKAPDKKWTNLQEAHELYCAGHLMEAACAHYEATGKDSLLKILEKTADCIYEQFMKVNPRGCPGHPEVELALLRLARASGNPKYRELAEHFLDVRGQAPNYFQEEKKERGWTLWGNINEAVDTDYMQATLPVREQKDAVGHAVRAVYLYTAMADAAGEDGDESLKAACRTLWESITQRRMYLTGGIGSTTLGEAFTVDYDLPNDTVYAETCASIGLIFFARRMLQLEARGEYGDVMERALYNTVLAGMELTGKRFFYCNPLEVVPGISGKAATQKHVDPQRPGWYACACCPPNVARLLSSIGSYAYGEGDHSLYVHLYLGGTVKSSQGYSLSCRTDYPHQGTVDFTFHGHGETTLIFRMPGWSQHTTLTVNGELQDLAALTRDGYAYLTRTYQEGDAIQLTFDMTPFKVYASSRIPADTGKAAVQRGPLVYCAEGVDNDGDVLSLSFAEEGILREEPQSQELGGIVPLTAEGWRAHPASSLYTRERPQREPADIHLVPYYAWGNRGLNQMRVWLPET
ncbi:MAG: glycoside hydrolase family 127 protein [Acutalibacter sp.]